MKTAPGERALRAKHVAGSRERTVVVGAGRSCHTHISLKTLMKRGKDGALLSSRTSPVAVIPDVRGLVADAIEKAVTPLNEGQVSQLVGDYMDGDLVSVLAARYGIYHVTVSEHLRRRNAPARVKGLLPSEAEESTVLYEEGYSLASIGKHFGVTGNTVKNVLLKWGTRIRGPNELRHNPVPEGWYAADLPDDDEESDAGSEAVD